MTHKYFPATPIASLDESLINTPDRAIHHFENSKQHSGHDLWDDIKEALTEKDIMGLRSRLKEITPPEMDQKTPESHNDDFIFDLSRPVDPALWEELQEESDLSGVTQALPRIHLHHHKRNMSEHVHRYYKEQAMAHSDDLPESIEAEHDPDWDFLEEAMKEGDVMDLRHKLSQIAKSVSSHPYALPDIEAYLDGEMESDDVELFEEELAFNADLRSDIDLHLELEEAIGEQDILSLRDMLHSVNKYHNSHARDLEEVDAYLEGTLPEEALDDFMEELHSSAILKREVELVDQVGRALGERDVMSLRDKLKEVATAETKVAGKSLLPPGKEKGFRQLATVAAIALLVLGFYSLQSPPWAGQGSYDTFYKSPTAPSTFREVSALPSGGLTQGFTLYNKGYYASALLILEKEASSEPFNPAAVFFTGASYQGLKEYNKALVEYDRVIHHHDNLFVEQAEWYAALSLVGSGDTRNAVTRLEAVAERKGYYARDAGKLLTRLRKISQ